MNMMVSLRRCSGKSVVVVVVWWQQDEYGKEAWDFFWIWVSNIQMVGGNPNRCSVPTGNPVGYTPDKVKYAEEKEKRR